MRVLSPILAKELWPLLRNKRIFWMIMAVVCATAAGFLMIWAELSRTISVLSQRAGIGRQIFVLLSTIQLYLLGVLAPVLTSGVITSEREAGTMDMLQATLLSPGTILRHKWWAAVSVLVLTMTLLLPVEMLIFQLGGVGASEFGRMGGLIAATALAYGMMGLAVSSMMRRSAAAALTSIFLVALLNAILPFGFLFMRNFLHLYSNTAVVQFAAIVSPAIHAVFMQVPAGGFGGVAMAPLYYYNLSFLAAVFLLSILVARRGINRRETGRTVVARKLIDDAAVLEVRRKQFPYYLIDPLARPQRIADGANPVLVRERRTGVAARPAALIRLCYLGTILSLTLGLSLVVIDPNEAAAVSAIFLSAVAFIALPPLTAVAIAKEHEQGTLDLLLNSPLSPHAIVRAKFRVAMAFILILMASFMIPHNAAHVLFFDKGYTQTSGLLRADFCMAVYLASFCALFAATGLYVSSRAAKSANAMITTYLALALLTLAPYLADFLITRGWYMMTGAPGRFSYSRPYRVPDDYFALSGAVGPAFSAWYYIFPPRGNGVWGRDANAARIGISLLYAALTWGAALLLLDRAGRNLARRALR